MRRSRLLILILLHLFNLEYSQAQTISAGRWFSLFLCENGSVMACGINSFNQLGDGTGVDKSIPFQINSINNVISVSAGFEHSLFLKKEGSVYACGYNFFGQLGTASLFYPYSTTPEKVVGLAGIIAISAGAKHSLFLKNDGTVWACGSNDEGQLGLGTITGSKSATMISNLNNIIAISAGGAHSIFLKNDGTVWVCGSNYFESIGLDSSISSTNTPTQITSLTNVKAISAGGSHSIFLKNDGTVWTCGYNSSGQLGLGYNSIKENLTIINTLSNIINISAGQEHSIFLKNDGTVLACGANIGFLGDGTNIERHSPVQSNTPNGIIAISAGAKHSLFLRNDAVVWATGNGGFGELGDGSTNTIKYSPIQSNLTCGVATGLEENETSLDFKLYPNPSNGRFIIQSLSTEPNSSEIRLYNNLGQCVFSQIINSRKSAIDLYTKDKGIYFYQFITSGVVRKTGKIVFE